MKWILPSGRRASPASATAATVGRWMTGCPVIWRSAGRASNSNDTSELTGLPGNPNTGISRAPGAAASIPNANGFAGLMAICIQRMVAIRPRTALTTS